MEAKSRTTRLAVALAIGMGAGISYAQSYPSKPVRLLVGFAPGGAADIVGRMIGQKLSDATGQSFFVDNRPGASATIAAELAAKAAPDGYTLLIGIPTSHSILPSLVPKLNFDPLRDFTPVTMLAKSPLLLAVHASLPVRSVADLIKLAKSRRGQLTCGTGGTGTPQHMACELFNLTAGVSMLPVPYKGEAPAIVELLGGQISLIFGGIVTVLPHIRAEKLRGIATTGAERVVTLPDLPTVAEAGAGDYAVDSWYGLLGPAGLSGDIVAKLGNEAGRTLSLPDIKERLATQGLFASTSTPEQLGAYMKAELAKWAHVVKESGIRLE